MMKRFMIILLLVQIVNSRFLESPTSQTVNVGENAVFRCQHETANFFRWKVNGTLFSPFSMPIPGVTQGSADNHLVSTLTVAGRLDYNETEVVCVAQFDSGMEEEATEGAFLYIGGSALADPIVTTSSPSSDFIIQPSETVAAMMTPAMFYCQHQDRNAFIVWSLNGTRLEDHTGLNYSISSVPDRNGHLVHALNILARPVHNMTTVQCIGIYQSSTLEERTPPVQLLIQGELAAVTNIERHPGNASITWESPFSLNLSNIDPDVSYCVVVNNITCGRRENIINVCNVQAPYITNASILNKADLFEIIVTPSSNVQGAVPGMMQTTREKYIYSNSSAISANVSKSNKSDTVDVTVHIETDRLLNQITPDSLLVSLASATGNSSRNFTVDTVILTESLYIFVPGVPFREHWICTIFATRCGGITVSDITTLSTFDIQNIQISDTSESIIVGCDLINGSRAAGILIIAYSVTDAADIHYGVAQSDNRRRITAILSCLPGNLYSINVFVIDEDGLPIHNPVSSPLTANTTGSTLNNGSNCDENQLINYDIYPKNDSVCVECNSTCVVVVHQNVTSLNSSHLSIHSVHRFNKTAESDTAFGCIPNVNLEDYQLGVIPLILTPVFPTPEILTTTDSEDEGSELPTKSIIIETVLVSTSLLVTGGVVLLVMLGIAIYACCQYRNKKRKSENMPQGQTEPETHPSGPENIVDADGQDGPSTESGTNNDNVIDISSDVLVPPAAQHNLMGSLSGDYSDNTGAESDNSSLAGRFGSSGSAHKPPNLQIKRLKSSHGFQLPDSGHGTPITRRDSKGSQLCDAVAATNNLSMPPLSKDVPEIRIDDPSGVVTAQDTLMGSLSVGRFGSSGSTHKPQIHSLTPSLKHDFQIPDSGFGTPMTRPDSRASLGSQFDPVAELKNLSTPQFLKKVNPKKLGLGDSCTGDQEQSIVKEEQSSV